jgi:predicted lipoprotein with Yx(FWY)xxD motif/uncharacterized cupredoxin-like copper-binding protein
MKMTKVSVSRREVMKGAVSLGIVASATLAAPRWSEAQDDGAAMPTVFVRQDAALGSYLSDPSGMTLYMFANDTVADESTCYDDCASAWPPVTAEEPLQLPLLMTGELALIDRTDGTKQLTYNGIPLYYWQNDQQAGDTTGHGVGGVWFVVAPGSEFGAGAPEMATPAAMNLGTPAAAGEIAVSLSEFSITAEASTLKVGEEYTFRATNNGTEVHEMIVEAAGAADEPLELDGGEAEIEDLEPGDTATLTVTFTEAGSYQLSCWVVGHYPAGMAFNLKVVE